MSGSPVGCRRLSERSGAPRAHTRQHCGAEPQSRLQDQDDDWSHHHALDLSSCHGPHRTAIEPRPGDPLPWSSPTAPIEQGAAIAARDHLPAHSPDRNHPARSAAVRSVLLVPDASRRRVPRRECVPRWRRWGLAGPTRWRPGGFARASFRPGTPVRLRCPGTKRPVKMRRITPADAALPSLVGCGGFGEHGLSRPRAAGPPPAAGWRSPGPRPGRRRPAPRRPAAGCRCARAGWRSPSGAPARGPPPRARR